MMVEHYNLGHMVEATVVPEPNLCTGVGHGHPRKFERERPKKGTKAKKRKKAKMCKASRRRNRKG